MTKHLLLPCALLAAGGTAPETEKQNVQKIDYPATRKDSTAGDTLHGTFVADPYRWLENDTSAETAAWVKAQNAVTNAYIGAIPYRVAMAKRYEELYDLPKVMAPLGVGAGYLIWKSSGLQSQCETTKNTEQGPGASLLGFSKLYGQVAGGQAEYLRVPHADYGAVKVPKDHSDDRYLFLSDVLPTAWQSVEYADVPYGGTLLVIGAGPIGDMATRIARHRGHRVIVTDLVDERLRRVSERGAEALDVSGLSGAEVADHVRDLTAGRGADSVIDAVGMEAHGSGGVKAVQKLVGLLPDAVAEPLMLKAGVDRLEALTTAFDAVRRGGTVSVVGVYGGAADPLPMFQMFDKQLTIRMGQANVRRWTDDILDLLNQDEDVLGVESFATHHVSLEEAPAAYETFQKKEDGAVKIVFKP